MKSRIRERTTKSTVSRLGFESLEDRRLLATFIVSNTNDSGEGSLRRQIQLSNATPGVDEITFAPELDGQTISLSTGQIRISQAVTIDSQGADITIDASASDPTPSVVDGMGSRVFQITDNTTDFDDFFVEFRGLTITGGDINANGGAIHTRQVLRMYDVEIRDSHATGSGGGIYATKLVRIEDSLITGNSAGEAGSGMRRWYDENLNDHPVRFYRTEFIDNHAGTFGGGLAASTISSNASNELLIDDCVFRGNSSGSAGGGLSVNSYAESPIRIRNSIVSENSTAGTGGGVSIQTYNSESEIRDTIISDNSAESGGGLSASRVSAPVAPLDVINVDIIDNEANVNGGGVLSSHPLRVSQSRISGNVASDTGGGVFATNYYGYTTINDSWISGNQARRGGGIGVSGYGSNLDMNASTVSDNLATFLGGGIWMEHREYSEISNSTISGNRSAGDAGGIFVETQYRSFLTIEYSTAANNIADLNGNSALDLVGGIRINGSFASLSHVISADNLRRNAEDQLVPAVDFMGSLQSGAVRNNLFGIVADPLDDDSNIVGVDPMLGPLAENGGLTPTHALLPGSPAIDAGADETPYADSADQRGLPFARIQDGDE
ncbi:MAG: choice-of-anchor Q domain-containing protein, partial [Planctomycetota bacterium]